MNRSNGMTMVKKIYATGMGGMTGIGKSGFLLSTSGWTIILNYFKSFKTIGRESTGRTAGRASSPDRSLWPHTLFNIIYIMRNNGKETVWRDALVEAISPADGARQYHAYRRDISSLRCNNKGISFSHPASPVLICLFRSRYECECQFFEVSTRKELSILFSDIAPWAPIAIRSSSTRRSRAVSTPA